MLRYIDFLLRLPTENQEIFNLNNNNNNSDYDCNSYERMIIGIVNAMYSIDDISIALLGRGLK